MSNDNIVIGSYLYNYGNFRSFPFKNDSLCKEWITMHPYNSMYAFFINGACHSAGEISYSCRHDFVRKFQDFYSQYYKSPFSNPIFNKEAPMFNGNLNDTKNAVKFVRATWEMKDVGTIKMEAGQVVFMPLNTNAVTSEKLELILQAMKKVQTNFDVL